MDAFDHRTLSALTVGAGVLAAGGLAAGAAPAVTVVPAPTGRSCVGTATVSSAVGCAEVYAAGGSLAASPDGRMIVTANGDLGVFESTASGALVFRDCVGSATVPEAACARAAPDLVNATSAQVTPDGRYVLVGQPGGIVVLRRVSSAPAGLREVSCRGLRPAGAGGCSRASAGILDVENGAVTVAGDGKAAFFATANRLVSLAFDARSGRLSFRGCIATRSSAVPAGAGCVRSFPRLTPFNAVVTSRDGRTAYMESGGGPHGRILVFGRQAGGALAYRGCAGPAGSGCPTRTPGISSRFLAVSPDGRDLYVAGVCSVHLRIDRRTGALRTASCARETFGAGPVQVSRDGRSVISAATSGGIIRRFSRDRATGRVRYTSCAGCGRPVAPTGLPPYPAAVPVLSLVRGAGNGMVLGATSSFGPPGSGLIAAVRPGA